MVWVLRNVKFCQGLRRKKLMTYRGIVSLFYLFSVVDMRYS